MSQKTLFGVLACLFLAASAESATVISTNSTWKYFKGRVEASSPTNAWRQIGYDDSSWLSAITPFYYGEPLTGTELTDMNGQYTCVFLRHTFSVTNVAQLEGIRLDTVIDDGLVAWVNGTEVFRFNLGPGELGIGAAALAAIEFQPQSRVVTNVGSLLVEGENVIAIQAFNSALSGSSDFVINAALQVYAFDSQPPTIAQITPAPGTVFNLSQATVRFSEPVVGVEASDLFVNGLSASTVTGGGDTYTFSFPKPLYGHVEMTWAATHGIVDLALNPNAFNSTGPGSTWTYEFVDQAPPTVANLFPPAGATIRSLGQVEVTFSEDVAGVDAADLRINGQPATNVVQQGSGPFTFHFAPPANGVVNLSWASGHGITDLAAQPNAFAGGGWSYTLDPNATAGDLVINEILAANQTGLADEDGEAQGWIEIYNRGSAPVSLAGWSLSDDSEDPGRWVFPAVTVNASSYLVVFASGKDRASLTPPARLHTNFKLAEGGEFLGLYSPDSPRTLISSFSPFPVQRNDYSYGYDSTNNLRYFAVPTPGAPNGISSVLAITEPVHFSVQRGFYSNAFDLYLSSETPGAQIRYTRDGMEPTASIGTFYSGPLRITNSSMVRAVAFRPNFLPSEVHTHTYIFNANAAVRSLPVISIVTAVTNLIGPSGIIGISNVTQLADGRWVPATNNPSISYHNPSLHGLAWERPVSVEFIRPQDNSGFQVDCGIRVQGSDYQRPRTTTGSKFSYRLYFRGDYGAGRLNYELFPNSPVHSFDQMVLRAGFNDPSNPFIRDELTRRLSADQGQIASHGTFVNVFTNGGYAGYYNPCERIHEEMLQSHQGGSDDWDVVSPSFATGSGENGVVDGTRANFVNLVNFINQQDTRAQLVYQQIQTRLDIVNFVDYCLLNVYCAMGDWPANNWRAGKDRGPGGIWKFYIWDGEWAMGIYNRLVTTNTFAMVGGGPDDSGLGSAGSSEIAQIYQRLRLNPEFRLLWADRVQKHFFNGGALTDSNIVSRFNEMRNEMRTVIPNMDLGILNTWVPQRRGVIFGHFGLYGLNGSTNAPVFNQHGGRVPTGFNVTMTNVSGTMYYTQDGSDPREAFTGGVAASAQPYSGTPIQILQTTRVKARSLDGTNWSAVADAVFQADTIGSPLRITEIMYNPVGGSAYEFIEIQNISSVAVDMSGMSLDGISFTFPDGSTIGAGQRIVLASDVDPGRFATAYPSVSVAGYFGGQLSNGGERITLKDRLGNTLTSVDYDDEGLWPTAPDGAGYSLELLNVYADPDDPLNWFVGGSTGGTPGGAGSVPPPPSAPRINEVQANSATPWVEIYNGGPTVNLAGYSLSDDANARKYVFPATTLNAGAFLVVYCDNNVGAPGLHTDFVLNPHGDEIILYDAQTNRISSVSFGIQIPNYSLGRFSDAALDPWALSVPTPGAGNTAAPLGASSSVVVNEWLANSFPGQSDWVELWNNSAQPVALKGTYLATTNALFQIPSRSFIAPFGFTQLFADETPGPDHLDFRLPAAGGQIAFYTDAGAEANRVEYGVQAEGISQGRLPDGTTNIVAFAGTASPGASNYVSTYAGPYVNEVMARNVSAVTNSNGRVADWVEIYNPGAQPFDLGGMSLSVDEPQSRQWIFPTNTIIGASAYLVVWCDGNLPPSTITGPVLNVGRSLNGESGGVYLFNGAGQLVNSVAYGFQIENQPIGRVASNWRLLATATPGAVNGAAATLGAVTNVTVNEWMANPAKGDDWFELYNVATQPVDLGGLALTDDPSIGGQGAFRIPALSFIPAKGWVKYVADGNSGTGFNHVNFSLDAEGETLRLYNTVNTTNFVAIDSVYFGAQEVNVSQGRLPDGGQGTASFPGSATPGASNYRLPENVTINEVRPHIVGALPSAVELYNPGNFSANLGGWYLSNSRDNLKKYRIPDGTSIAPGAYLVIAEPALSFSLDAYNGGELILSAADPAGNLTGTRVEVAHGPTGSNVSFGRYRNSQEVEFVAQARNTLGAANGLPAVGPVVINEIMYNPLPWPDSIPNADAEFLELKNITGSPVNLYSSSFPANVWKLAGGVEFEFPAGISIPANGYLIVANFDPNTNGAAVAEFRNRYSLHPAIPIYGPYRGKLDNAGEEIQLLMPSTGQTAPYILVDHVAYGDSAPWPSGPVDGGGLSLQRRDSTAYGNEPLNWLASQPTPGNANGIGVVALPTVVTPPQSQTVPFDSIVNLSVAASGPGPLSYQWRFNGLNIPNANANALTLDYVQLEHDGVYDVIVGNAAGTALSAPATLVVTTPPQILNGVPTLAVNTNTTVTLSVVLRASKPISYQWSFNGSMIPGATEPTYTIASAQLENSGEYSVLVSNPAGSAVSTGTLIVLVRPTFAQNPQNQTVVVGDDATFRVLVIGTQPMGYRWRTNNQFANPFPGAPVYTLRNVPMTYSNMSVACVASNIAATGQGQLSGTARLFVLPDSDGDHLPDIWEQQYGQMNPDDDNDHDGMSNREEYLAGTDPNNALSYLRIDILNSGLAGQKLSFMAISNKTYTLQYRTEWSTNGWGRLLDAESRTTNRVIEVFDYSPADPARFYQVVTPQQ